MSLSDKKKYGKTIQNISKAKLLFVLLGIS
jgi:hypothetical protein